MLVRQPDRLRPARLDREDAGADQVEPGELEKGGVAGLGDDALVGLPASSRGSSRAEGSAPGPWNANPRTTAPSGTGTSSSASCRAAPGLRSRISIIVVATWSRMTTPTVTPVICNAGERPVAYERAWGTTTCDDHGRPWGLRVGSPSGTGDRQHQQERATERSLHWSSVFRQPSRPRQQMIRPCGADHCHSLVTRDAETNRGE